MTSIHNIKNNMNSNNWKYNKNTGVWKNKHGYEIKNTGKIFNEGKELYFPIARETIDDLQGKALRFEYTGDGSSVTVVSNRWYNSDDQYCHRQTIMTKKRRKRAGRRRKECKENEHQLEKNNKFNKQKSVEK